jgi:hypothetical protein
VDDIMSLPGPKFYRLTWRLAAYQGAMASRSAMAQQEVREAPEPPPQPQPVPARQSLPVHQVPRVTLRPGSKEAVAADPIGSQIFSFG